MTPEQREALLSGLLSLSDRVNDQHCFDLADTVDSLLAQARADERERVITAMSEYLPADSRAKIAAAIRARKDGQ